VSFYFPHRAEETSPPKLASPASTSNFAWAIIGAFGAKIAWGKRIGEGQRNPFPAHDGKTSPEATRRLDTRIARRVLRRMKSTLALKGNHLLRSTNPSIDPVISPPLVEPEEARAGRGQRRLRLLSFNIQAGITTSKYRHYLTHSWKHVLPCAERLDTLDRIATLAGDFDFVGLQESDAGSLRSAFINQTEYLATRAGFPYWYDQTNRNLGHLGQHSIGLLSRFRPSEITEVRLPGMIPGRGALCVRFGRGEDALLLLIVHLALGRRARERQLANLAELIADERHIILMGDLNCRSESKELEGLRQRSDLGEPIHGLFTFPSWRPRRNIDHILVSASIQVDSVRVLNQTISDHLPIAMDVTLPDGAGLIGAPPVPERRAAGF
jgi:endonuclease/exonuclease/phosphatase family metal-dependent hydrolase